MLIARVKIDKRQRITLPTYFMQANNLSDKTHILIKSVDGKNDEVIIKFINLDDNDNRDTETTEKT